MDEVNKRKWPFMGDTEDSEERYFSLTPILDELSESDEICFGSVRNSSKRLALYLR